mmetsp:Transcript_118289/g.235615  ORF Transcript_118289/g.235615 Transcript_118289/m.235615 type:complete len:115 (+) Transcript_118289:1564-1908(+)
MAAPMRPKLSPDLVADANQTCRLTFPSSRQGKADTCCRFCFCLLHDDSLPFGKGTLLYSPNRSYDFCEQVDCFNEEVRSTTPILNVSIVLTFYMNLGTTTLDCSRTSRTFYGMY